MTIKAEYNWRKESYELEIKILEDKLNYQMGMLEKYGISKDEWLLPTKDILIKYGINPDCKPAVDAVLSGIDSLVVFSDVGRMEISEMVHGFEPGITDIDEFEKYIIISGDVDENYMLELDVLVNNNRIMFPRSKTYIVPECKASYIIKSIYDGVDFAKTVAEKEGINIMAQCYPGIFSGTKNSKEAYIINMASGFLCTMECFRMFRKRFNDNAEFHFALTDRQISLIGDSKKNYHYHHFGR